MIRGSGGTPEPMITATILVRGLALATLASGFRSAPLQSPSGAPLHWDMSALDQSPLVLRMYKTYPFGQPEPERLKMAVVNGMREWSWALGRPIPFDLWEGQEEGTFPPRILPDEMNSIFWRSAGMRQGDPVANEMKSSQAAFAQVYFDEITGELEGFDLTLNDVDFRFVSRQDVAIGAVPPPDPNNDELYLEDAVLHELGHALGLDHSLDPDAVLFPTPRHTPETLSCDDISSVRNLYLKELAPAQTAALFELSGVLNLEGVGPLERMGVMAVHQQNPKIRATTVSKEGGSFHFSGLERGEYALFVYPLSHLKRYFVGAGPIPSHRLCPNPVDPEKPKLVPAQWLASTESPLDWVNAQGFAAPPVQYNLRCDPRQRHVPATASQRLPVKLQAFASPLGPIWGLADRFRNDPALLPNEVRHYSWTHNGGSLTVNWMSDPVGSLHSSTIAILKEGAAQGEYEEVARLDPSLLDPDLHQLAIPSLEPGDYLLSVQRNGLRVQASGILGEAVPSGSYAFWLTPGAPVPNCPMPPKTWPNYESPSAWPPGVHEDRGCSLAGPELGSWAFGGCLALLAWRRQRRRG